MAYPGKHRKTAPRNVPVAAGKSMGPVPIERLRVDFTDPLLHHAALQAKGTNWQETRLAARGIAVKAMAELVRLAARTNGVHVMAVQLEKGVELCLATAPVNHRLFLVLMPASYRDRVVASNGVG